MKTKELCQKVFDEMKEMKRLQHRQAGEIQELREQVKRNSKQISDKKIITERKQ